MVDIIETIQDEYVSMVKEGSEQVPADFVFFGGDQLTEETARNIQRARMDGHSLSDRLEAVRAKNEDWHAIRIAYKVRGISISCIE